MGASVLLQMCHRHLFTREHLNGTTARILTKALMDDKLTQIFSAANTSFGNIYFHDSLCTHTLAFEGESNVAWYEGSYSEYEEDRRKRLGEDADQPHRIKYRRLTHD